MNCNTVIMKRIYTLEILHNYRFSHTLQFRNNFELTSNNTADDNLNLNSSNSEISSSCLSLYLNTDAYFGGCLLTIILDSPFFCKTIFAMIIRNEIPSSKFITTVKHDQMCVNHHKFVIQLNLINDYYKSGHWLDWKWNYKMCSLVVAKMIHNDALSWLNTLGGGFSALGDYFIHHAQNAANISAKQLKIALKMEDSPLVIRCKLYYAQSLMQKNQLRKAKIIIRSEYAKAKSLPVKDERLINSCYGIWARLQFLYSQKSLLKIRSV